MLARLFSALSFLLLAGCLTIPLTVYRPKMDGQDGKTASAEVMFGGSGCYGFGSDNLGQYVLDGNVRFETAFHYEGVQDRLLVVIYSPSAFQLSADAIRFQADGDPGTAPVKEAWSEGPFSVDTVFAPEVLSRYSTVFRREFRNVPIAAARFDITVPTTKAKPNILVVQFPNLVLATGETIRVPPVTFEKGTGVLNGSLNC